MPIFGSKKASPVEIVRTLCDALQLVVDHKDRESGDKEKSKKIEKVLEEVTKNMTSLKQTLLKAPDQDNNPELVAQVCHEIYKSSLIPLLVKSLPYVDFENRKDSVHIFSYLLTRKVGVRQPTVDYLLNAPEESIFKLIEIYSCPDAALNVGMILRECAKYEELCRIILESPVFYELFQLIENNSFDIASDAFSTFKELLTRHKRVVCNFIAYNYKRFFDAYHGLLLSENYVTKRQSTKLLGEILLDRCNNTIMGKYVCNPENLKISMNLLRDKSSSVQFEAFHIFKVFIANPDKPTNIVDILTKNRDRLVEFLLNFQNSKDKDDEQFSDEKNYVIKTITELPS